MFLPYHNLITCVHFLNPYCGLHAPIDYASLICFLYIDVNDQLDDISKLASSHMEDRGMKFNPFQEAHQPQDVHTIRQASVFGRSQRFYSYARIEQSKKEGDTPRPTASS